MKLKVFFMIFRELSLRLRQVKQIFLEGDINTPSNSHTRKIFNNLTELQRYREMFLKNETIKM